jgi:hypothetical protein
MNYYEHTTTNQIEDNSKYSGIYSVTHKYLYLTLGEKNP